MSDDEESVSEEEDVPLETLPEPWQNFMRNGQVLTALILSTSFSEKYKGRHLVPDGPGSTVEVRLPDTKKQEKSAWLKLLHRSGNKEAVAFIWVPEDADDKTLYVAFSPMRYRSQFFKIYCAGMVQDCPEEELGKAGISYWRPGQASPATALSGKVVLPISAYVHVKLRRMWGEQGLWAKLTECVEKYPSHRLMFAGISHGAALAQAAALQFRLTRPEADVYAVSWNAYRWTDQSGRMLAQSTLGSRLMSFVLSRRGESQATRYWDSVTGFPAGYTALPNPVLLDADTGHLYEHSAPERTSYFSAVALMRMFELHFARSALIATKKCMALIIGSDETVLPHEDDYLGAPVAERFQERVLSTHDLLMKQGKQVRRQATEELALVRDRIHLASEEMRQSAAGHFQALRTPSGGGGGGGGALGSSSGSKPNRGKKRRHQWWKRLTWCCKG